MDSFDRQQVAAREAWARGKRVEGVSIRIVTRHRLEFLKDKYDLTESQVFGAGFAGEGKYELLLLSSGTIGVRFN